MLVATREHRFCYGHRIWGHKDPETGESGLCSHLHGHEGIVFFTIKVPELDEMGMSMDFGVMKQKLDSWINQEFDHRFLLWYKDPLGVELKKLDPKVVLLKFSPTAEGIADYLLKVVGPQQLKDTNATLVEVKFFETSKCSATASL